MEQPSKPIRARWTPDAQRLFLAALLKSGSVSAAARAVHMSRSSAYRLRTRLPGSQFVRLWDQALAEHVQRLREPFPSSDASPSPR